jgi:hypothetical protein
MFNENSRYELPSEDQADWNKLIGIASIRPQLKNPAHVDSIRIAWRYYQGEYQINYYQYVNGRRKFGNPIRIATNNRYRFKIAREKNAYFLTVSDYVYNRNMKLIHATELMHPPTRLQVVLPPYFGGDNPSPKEVAFGLFVS